jgi:hypothetical protein
MILLPMELPPEERQRIYQEEKARLEADQKSPKEGIFRRGGPVRICLFICTAAFILVAVYGKLQPYFPKSPHSKQVANPEYQQTRMPNGSEETLTISSPLLCSKSILDIDTLARVRAAGDTDGARGLVARDKALLLLTGTTLHVVYHSSERASLYVRSGLLVGEDCWIQPGWITAATR